MGFRPAYGSNVTPTPHPQEPPAHPPLAINIVRTRLLDAGRAGQIVHLAQCDSTNARAAALDLQSDWALVVAEEQTAGRGRLSRSWVSAPGSGLLFSVALSAPAPPAHLSLLPLVVGLVVAQQVRVHGVAAQVKWPNDIIVTADDGAVSKLGGVLLERTSDAVIVGVGLNVLDAPGTADAPEGTSLLDQGLTVTGAVRETILADCTIAILAAWDQLQGGGHQQLVADYRRACATLGAQVRASLPDGSDVVGEAVDIDPSGRLLVVPEVADGSTPASGVVSLSAADIVHLRTV